MNFQIAGTDEAGRGPLAGHVVAAAVVLTEEQKQILLNSGLRDSKKLTEKSREKIFLKMNDIGVIWRARSASPKRIDEMNILQASLWAMKKSLEALPCAFETAIVDGNKKIPNLATRQEAVVGADDKFAEVMAASVVAKVLRDRTMVFLDALYPQYGLAKHKGYPTAAHRAAVTKFGMSPIHRATFCKKFVNF